MAASDLTTGTDLPNRRSKLVNYDKDEIIGFQKDKEGTVWTCVPVPYIARDSIDGIMNVNIISAAEAVESADDSVTLMLTAMTISVKSSTKKIASINQRQSLQTYKPVSSRTIEVSASQKFFDADGRPIHSQELVSRNRRSFRYHEIDYLPAAEDSAPTSLESTPSQALPRLSCVVCAASGSGRGFFDLRKSFVSYLIEHDMNYLIPDHLSFLYPGNDRGFTLQIPMPPKN